MSKKKRKREGVEPDEPRTDDVAGSSEEDSGDAGGGSLLSHPIADKVLYLYETLAMSLGGGLFLVMCVHWLHVPDIVEWVLGILVMIAVLLSRTVFSNDMGEIMADARAQAETGRIQDEREIAAGDYDGVPKIIQRLMPLPDEEERRRDAHEAERQRQLMEDLRTRRGRRKGKGKGSKADGEDEPEGAETERDS